MLALDYIEAPENQKLTLDGSNSTDPDDGIVSYFWTQVDGKPVKLSDRTSRTTTFIAPETDQNGTNLTFVLLPSSITITSKYGLGYVWWTIDSMQIASWLGRSRVGIIIENFGRSDKYYIRSLYL